MSTFCYGSLLGALLLLLTGCYGNTPPVVKLGLIAPFEELYRDDGYAALAAVRLAVNQRNATGGVAGHQVALVALNDNDRPAEARQQAASLTADNDVLGVIGPLHSATAQEAGPVLAAHGLPWLALASLTPQQQPGGFALEVSPEAVISRAGELLTSHGAAGAVAIVADPDSAPPGLAGAIWLGDAAGGARLAQQLPPGAALAGGPELGSPIFNARADQAATGVTWVSAGPDSAALPATFVADYRAVAGSTPSPQAVLAYDATNLLLDALERAGRQDAALTRSSVRQALIDLGAAGWQGLAGPVAWQDGACPAEQPCWPRLDPPLIVHHW